MPSLTTFPAMACGVYGIQAKLLEDELRQEFGELGPAGVGAGGVTGRAQEDHAEDRDITVVLGLEKPDAQSHALKTLNDFWGTYEIAGVALVDMAVWHWMYDHPNATPAELRDATVNISRDVWNKYYAPVFGKRDVVLLGVYSHMIDSFLYLPDYPIGHMIAFQIEEQMEKAGNIGQEFERMATVGNVTPDLWMKKATGAPVGAESLLAATRKALTDLAGSRN